jgi:hypothetical protein
MPPLPRSASLRALATLPLLIQMSACTTWRPVPGPVANEVSDAPIREARVTLRNGTRLSLRDVTVRTDSVIGFAAQGPERHSVPAADVMYVDRRQLSAGRTTAVVVGSLAGATLVLFGIAIASLGDLMSGP